jgi:dihydrofolate reductase
MRALTYYVAATLDGFIADRDGGFDFFPIEPDLIELMVTDYPETLPVQARGPLGLSDAPNKRFDTVVMGRATYEPALQAGVTSPYPHLSQYVFSGSLTGTDPAVQVVSEEPAQFVRDLKRQDGMGIWLCGGGKLAGALLDEIDELVVKHYPIVLGSGIPMVEGSGGPTGFKPSTSRTLPSGVAVTTYSRA